ncbi:MAG: MYG1 family protein, partial [Myxococcota bacterium]|nr:MYG1 family protein [Myxococcota bacterium]
MPLSIATHSGPFHADDVLAVALLRTFVDADATVVRTRDLDRIADADVVVDVGGIYDPDAGRFDHHQASYTGAFSSAGMVLSWLTETDRIRPPLAERLRVGVVSYVDDVDNGRRSPDPSVPCFPIMVQALNQPASTLTEFDMAFRGAVGMAEGLVRGFVAAQDAEDHATAIVTAQMLRADTDGSNLILLDQYVRWKAPYFRNGGARHRTEFVIHPGPD